MLILSMLLLRLTALPILPLCHNERLSKRMLAFCMLSASGISRNPSPPLTNSMNANIFGPRDIAAGISLNSVSRSPSENRFGPVDIDSGLPLTFAPIPKRSLKRAVPEISMGIELPISQKTIERTADSLFKLHKSLDPQSMPIRQSDFEDAGLKYKQGSFKMYSPEEWSLILEVYRKMLVEDSKLNHAARMGTEYDTEIYEDELREYIVYNDAEIMGYYERLARERSALFRKNGNLLDFEE